MQEKVQNRDFLKKPWRELNFSCWFRFLWISRRPGRLNWKWLVFLLSKILYKKCEHYKTFEHYAHFEQHWQMEVTLEIRLLPRHYSNDLSYMPEGSNRWRKRPLPSSANNRRMHRCAGSKNGGWGQSLFNKVLRWAYFMKWNLRFGLVWTFWRLLCSLISLTEKQKKNDFSLLVYRASK